MSKTTSSITPAQAAIIKGMLARGDRQQEIVAAFGGVINPGRISEIKTGRRFRDIAAAPMSELPPRGPYPPLH